MNRLKNTPKEIIPISKTPRRQRSSRFHITDSVEIEKLPLLKDAPSTERPELLTRKLKQCSMVFDFNDATSDLKGKEIKRAALTELVDYMTTARNILTDQVYPEMISMVRHTRATNAMLFSDSR